VRERLFRDAGRSRELGAWKEGVEQRHVRHPAPELAIMNPPNRLDRIPDLRRRDEDERALMRWHRGST
jgi:hypothetical protein